jgi:hypothetical protein
MARWGGFNDSWPGTVVFKRLVWPRGVVVGEIRAQDAAEMGSAQNDDVIQALPTDGAMSRSTKGFCQGALGAVVTWRIPRWSTRRVKASP